MKFKCNECNYGECVITIENLHKDDPPPGICPVTFGSHDWRLASQERPPNHEVAMDAPILQETTELKGVSPYDEWLHGGL